MASSLASRARKVGRPTGSSENSGLTQPSSSVRASYVCSTAAERARAYERIREELRAGRQAFVVCPLVEESEALQARAPGGVRERAVERPIFMRYVIAGSEEQVFPEGGGMLIRDDAGEVIGAVGVTGDTEDRDEELAIHGIHAAGLKTDEDCRGMGRHIGLLSKR